MTEYMTEYMTENITENITITYNHEILFLKEVKENDYYKLVNDKNEVAILFNSVHSAGWYTWNRFLGEKLIKDSRIIQYFFSNKYKDYSYNEFFTNIMNFEKVPHFSSRQVLKLAFIPQNIKFIIKEYDGIESIETFEEIEWFNA